MTAIARRARSFLGLLGLCAILPGCSTEYGLEYRLLTDPPQSVRLAEDGIEIPEGIVVAARVVGLENGDRVNDDLDFFRARTGVLGVAPVEGEGREFVFWGIEAGQTELAVTFDGTRVLEIPVDVTPARFDAPE
ncbi:MAG: hypothetical protein AAF928_02605 [Myxococcota bacterium]